MQNIPIFVEFLRVAALTVGELLNYTHVSREAGVSAKVIRSYFEILDDTLLDFRLQPWKKSTNRRMIETEKFYLFDVGVSNYLARRKPQLLIPEFGKSFERFIMMELKAYQAYKAPELLIHYWRTSTGQEVDFILGDMAIAIEVKAFQRIHNIHTKNLRALSNDHTLCRLLLVSFEIEPKKLSEILNVCSGEII